MLSIASALCLVLIGIASLGESLRWGTNFNSEQHLVIDWFRVFSQSDLVNVLHMSGSLHVEEMLEFAVIPEASRYEFLANFYNIAPGGYMYNDQGRGTVPFAAYFIKDKAPRYEYRLTTKGSVHRINVNMWNMKGTLRNLVPSAMWDGPGQGIHTTDNIDETKCNLKAMGNKHIEIYIITADVNTCMYTHQACMSLAITGENLAA